METEPDWDEEQLDLLLAARELRAEERDVGPHGHPLAETTSPQADPNRPGGWRYEVPLPSIDYAQRALRRAQRDRAAQFPDEDQSELQWTVLKTEK